MFKKNYAKRIGLVLLTILLLGMLPQPVQAGYSRSGGNSYIPENADLRTFNGHTYLVITDKMKPTEAELLCQAMGGYLASVTSAEENQFLMKLFDEYYAKAGLGEFTIGGTDRDSEGKWTWMSGESWSFSYWNSPTEPNDGLSRGEDYLLASKSHNWKWVDYFGGYDNYSSSFAFVCEWSSNIASTTPAVSVGANTASYNGHRYERIDMGMTWKEHSC